VFSHPPRQMAVRPCFALLPCVGRGHAFGAPSSEKSSRMFEVKVETVSVHAMKAYRGRRGITPRILNLDSRCS
jgi:hypothetical protein